MSRTPFIAGNWKMFKTIAEAEEFIQALLPKVSSADGVEVAICAPFLSLQALVDSARGSRVAIYAQTMHEADEGAFTGEVSPAMLAEIDVDGVVLGHSERREYFNETDRALALKVPAALEAGLTPILCVGETEEERERGETERKLRHQVQEGLERRCRSSGCPRSSSPTSRSGRSAPGAARRRSRRRRRSPSCARWSRASTRRPGRPCGASMAGR
jgi:triosephosphate isomerase